MSKRRLQWKHFRNSLLFDHHRHRHNSHSAIQNVIQFCLFLFRTEEKKPATTERKKILNFISFIFLMTKISFSGFISIKISSLRSSPLTSSWWILIDIYSIDFSCRNLYKLTKLKNEKLGQKVPLDNLNFKEEIGGRKKNTKWVWLQVNFFEEI